jgi:uncharacterized protein YegL
MARLDDVDLKTNAEPRAACLLILDTSSSMEGEPISELNAGLQMLQRDLQTDSTAKKRVEIGIVTFGSNVDVAQDFVTAGEFTAPTLSSAGSTRGLQKEQDQLLPAVGPAHHRRRPD